MPRTTSKRIPGSTELSLHRSVAQFLDWMLLPPAIYTTFPAGWTAMRKGAAGRLKGCGLKPGMPDILVFYNGSTTGIELKINAIQSKAQIEMAHLLRGAGVPVHVCKSIDDVYDALANVHSIPMRPYHYGYPSNVPAAKARRPPQPDACPPVTP